VTLCVPCVCPVRRAVRKRRSGVRRVARGRGGPLPPEPDPDYNFTPTILTIAYYFYILPNSKFDTAIQRSLFKRSSIRLRSTALIRPRSPRVPKRPTPRTRAIY
jgi:hypothetical protein